MKLAGALCKLCRTALLAGLSLAVLAVPEVWAGPLRRHPVNPRYFIDDSGKAIYLSGSHTWSNFKDFEAVDPPKPFVSFDSSGYLDLLVRHRHNFIRLWTWEHVLSGYWNEATGEIEVSRASPFPWPRTGPGIALDGEPRFDLNQFDQRYFDRLRARVSEARDRGIYVSIMLFEAHASHSSALPWRRDGHPFNAANNVNGIDADPNGDGYLTEMHTMTLPDVTRLQEQYVEKVIQTVNDLDNVLYEIVNEAGPGSTEWQWHVIRYIKRYETGLPWQHPVGMTFQWSSMGVGDNATLFESEADWISPGGWAYFDNPPAGDGRKVVIVDTDHVHPTTTDETWPWRAFLRGLNPIVMDAYNGDQWEPIRRAMGQTRTYADQMNLAAMTPQPALSSTGYALANPGQEYLIYQPGSGSFTVMLQPGTYRVEWFHPGTGERTSTDPVTASNGPQPFAPPFSGEVVLYLRTDSGGGAPTLTFSATPPAIQSGQSSTLTWSSVDATSCAASEGWSGSKALSSSERVSPASTTTYTLSCSGNGGSVSKSVTVTVSNATGPVTLTVSPTTMAPGGTVTATWSGVSAPTPRDWLGVYSAGTEDRTFQAWVYTSNCTTTAGSQAKASGSCALTMPTIPGTYELRLFANDGYTKLATSAAITVSTSGLPGDLNQDGKRDLVDVRLLIYMLLGQQLKTPEADLTGDGAVTLADVQALIRLLVGLPQVSKIYVLAPMGREN